MNTDLKSWRKQSGQSSEQVANALGVTMSMWSRWETGARSVPAHRVMEIESLTGISRHDLRPDIFGPSPNKEKVA